MSSLTYLVGALAILGYFIFQKKYKNLQIQLAIQVEKASKIDDMEQELKNKTMECVDLAVKYASSQEKILFLTNAQEKTMDSFRSLSFEALEKNSQSFLDLAKSTLEKYQEGAKAELEKRQISIIEAVAPVKEALTKIDSEMKSLEKERKGDQEALKEHLKLLVDSEKHLRMETSMLVKALRTPIGRGRWGEIQLKRVVELAGMIDHCDFYEQQSRDIGDAIIRPDLLIKLPGGRQVIVDAKVPLDAYLDASMTNDDEVKVARLKDHARQLRQHLSNLSKKSYWQHFQPSPELVILFLPSESIYSAALEYDPSLIELGIEQKVIMATPTTLIALLRAIAYGWKQESLSKHAEEVSLLGHELYKRLIDMTSHFSKMGKSLSAAVEAYNKGIGSLESRVLVSARKFKDLGAASSHVELEELNLIEKIVKGQACPVENTINELLN